VTVAVAIERRQVELAKRLADTVRASSTMRRRNHTGLEAENRHFYGYCGEAAVVNWLRAEGVMFRHVMGDPRKGNEIHVWANKLRHTIDVQTASQPHYRKLMLPANARLTADFYVAVRLETDPMRCLMPAEECAGKAVFDEYDKFIATASIIGWLNQERVDRLRVSYVNIPTRVCDYVALRTPDELIAILDKGEEVVH
jgi:hypothetical protein